MARDVIHSSVKLALEKDGWLVTEDPLRIDLDDVGNYYEVDLGAERVLAAEKEGTQIAVEIKSFLKPSILNEFHEVLGQYLNYRSAMADMQIERRMYLAVSKQTYEKMQEVRFINSPFRFWQIFYPYDPLVISNI